MLILTLGNLAAQQISGTVYDAKYDKPIEGANIAIENTNQGAVSDKDGKFQINGLVPGNYKILVTLLGYLVFDKDVVMDDKPLQEINIYLQPTSHTLNNDFAITARRIESSTFSSPEPITIVGNVQLEEERPLNTPEALTGATGVFVQKTNHGAGSPFIRGLTGNQNLLLIDGIRLNNATFRYGPNQYLCTVDQLMVQRIEVVRGAGSVLYGSDAMGGVINVLTKNPDYSNDGLKVGGSIYGKWMSDDMEKTGRAVLNLANKKFAFSGGFTYKDFGDIKAGGDIGVQVPTAYQAYSGDAKLKVKLVENYELIFAYQYDKQEDVPRYDKIISGYTLYNFDPQVRQLAYAMLKSTYKNKWFKQVNYTGSFNQSDETRILQKQDSEKVSTENDKVNAFGGTVEVNSFPSENWHFSSGIEYYHDKVYSKTTDTEGGESTTKRGYYPGGATCASIAVYTSHTVDVRKFSFVLGGRFNAYNIKAKDDTFGDVDVQPKAVVGSLSAIYHVAEHYNLIASVYNAFRAPNINDLSSFGTFNYGIEVPNPELDPEKSLNFEVGMKAKYEKLSGSIFLYRSQLKDLIARVEAQYNGQDSIDGEKVYQKENIAEAYIQGIEAELQYKFISWLSAYGNLTYTYGENVSDNEPMRRIPPLNGKIGLYYKCKHGFWSRLELLSAGEQDRLSGGDISDSRIPDGGTPGWNLLNLYAGYNWKWLELSTGLNNIFNEAYRTHGSGVDGYGRSVWIAIKVGF
jgi:outer membrane receptor protein involved in Fe transport